MKKKKDCNLKAAASKQRHPREGGDPASHNQLSPAFSLFELLISLTLLALVIALLATTGIQAAKMWQELEEEEVLINESRVLMHLLDRDLRNASSLMPLTFRNQSDLFFLTRNTNDDLVAVGYFFDPKKQGHYYRFVATAKETLAANHDGKLEELYTLAAANENHCKLIARHLLSCEFIQAYSLLEVNLAFGKTTPHYFLSTVVALPSNKFP